METVRENMEQIGKGLEPTAHECDLEPLESAWPHPLKPNVGIPMTDTSLRNIPPRSEQEVQQCSE